MSTEEEEKFFRKPKSYIREEAAKKIQAQLEALMSQQEYQQRQRKVDEMVKQFLESNPKFTDNTLGIAKAILRKYPKMDSNKNLDIVLPFALNIAYKMEQLLDSEIPEEWK